MVKTLDRSRKQEHVKFRVPRSVQEAIPIRRIWPDGIFQVGNQFSKSFSFTDINYAIAGKDDKTAMFLDYSELLNTLDSGASAKVTINNRRINKCCTAGGSAGVHDCLGGWLRLRHFLCGRVPRRGSHDSTGRGCPSYRRIP